MQLINNNITMFDPLKKKRNWEGKCFRKVRSTTRQSN